MSDRSDGSVEGSSRATGSAPGRYDTLRTIAVALGLGVAGPLLGTGLLLVVVVGLGLQSMVVDPFQSIVLSLLFTQLLGFGGVTVAYAHYRGFGLASFGIERPSLREVGLIVIGAVVALLLALAVAASLQAVGLEGAPNQAAESGLENPQLFLLLIPAAFLIIGPCEEALYRGVVQGRLRESLGPAISIGLAAILFAAIHVVAVSGPSQARLVTVGVLLAPGLIMGLAYEYTGNLVVPAGMHAVYDAILFGLLYVVAVST